MCPDQASQTELHQSLLAQYQSLQQQGLALDLTRGKPSSAQLDLCNELDGILQGNYQEGNTDLRNYGGLYGTSAARQLGASILEVDPEEILVGNNSSLTLMYKAVLFALIFGPSKNEKPWKDQQPKFLCPVPGYDRHFSICEEFGIEMINIPMADTGPDMDEVEKQVKADPAIKGIWCVPKYSNPTGATYSDETVERIAKLGGIAGEGFRVFWDNAYTVHSFSSQPAKLANILQLAKQHGTEHSIYQFASTSKVTFAGAGISWMSASKENLESFTAHLGMSSIGPDKINQARHTTLLPDKNAVLELMQKHAAILKPKFDCVLEKLHTNLEQAHGSWSKPEGGYFVSFDTQPGIASRVIQLSNECGVKLTPAGSTYPYHKDPEDKNIRLAPSLPPLEEVEKAMDVFVLCVKLATVEKELANS